MEESGKTLKVDPKSSAASEGQEPSSEPKLPLIDHAGDEAFVEEQEEEEDFYCGLEGDILPQEDAASFLAKLLMNEEEFKSYIKPIFVPKSFPGPFPEDQSAPNYGDQELLSDIVGKAGASIFMETGDPISEQAVNVLKSMKLSMYIVRMELIEQGERVKKLLFSYSGLNSLPVIFLNGHLIGGYEALWFIYYTHLTPYVMSKERQTSFEGHFTFEYDLIVIGGGPAGISTALESAKLGKKVALVNYVAPSARGQAWGIGGTYINAGSISKNIMYAASSYVHSFNGHGLTKIKKGTPNWAKMVTNICEKVKCVGFSLRSKLKEAGCDYVNGRAKFLTDHTIEVSFPKTGAKKLMGSTVFIIATGSRPRYPKYIQGASEHCITTDDFFWSAKPPGKTLILSGTNIGLEIATILANFNYPVTVLVSPLIANTIDWEIMRRAKSHMEHIKIRFLQELVVDSVSVCKNRPGLKVKGLNEKGVPFEENFDTVLMEFGRVPNTSHLGLCRIGIKVNPRSRKIIVDDEGRTNIKHVFALGDVVHGWPELATVGRKAGKTLTERLYKANMRYVDIDFVPERILFPVEYARIGKTEQVARTLFGNKIKSYEAESHVLGTLSNSPIRAYFYMKIICMQREKEEEVIAVHILCHKAAEIIQGLSISLRKGANKSDFEDMISLHPIFSEVVSNMNIRRLRTPLDVYKTAQKAQVKKAALNAIQAVQPFIVPKCKTVKKKEEEEVDEKLEESSKELECSKNKGPRISKSMEQFIINVIIKGKNDYIESEESLVKDEFPESDKDMSEETESSSSDESDSFNDEEEETKEDETEEEESEEEESEEEDTEEEGSNENESSEEGRLQESEPSQIPLSRDNLDESIKSSSAASSGVIKENIEDNLEKEREDDKTITEDQEPQTVEEVMEEMDEQSLGE